MENENYTVYMHRAPNNKVYIGVTSKKLRQRFGKNGIGYRSQQLFWRAIQKYGWNNIEHIIIATNLSKDLAYKLEIMLISEYKSNNPKYGYNSSIGGEASPLGSRHKLSEETRAKMSQAKLGEKHPFYGQSHSVETKEKIRNSMLGNTNAKGSIRSLETRKKISEASKGRKISDATREKLRQRAIEQWKRKRGEI